MKLSLLLVFLLSFNSFAQVKYIDKDVPAPYNGFLFTVAKTKEVRKELIEKDQLKIFNEALKEVLAKQNEVVRNQKEQVKLLSDQNTKMATEVDRQKSLTTFQRVLWFSLGITAAGLAVYGAKQIVQ